MNNATDKQLRQAFREAILRGPAPCRRQGAMEQAVALHAAIAADARWRARKPR